MVMRCLGIEVSLILVLILSWWFEYIENGVAFEGGYLEEVMEFGKIQKCIDGFDLLDLSQTDYAQV